MPIEQEIWWAPEPLEKKEKRGGGNLPFPKSEIFIFLNDSDTFGRYSVLINLKTQNTTGSNLSWKPKF